MPRPEVMRHMLEKNIGLTISKQVKASKDWRHCLISELIIESSFVSNKTSEITSIFPLYLYPDRTKKDLFTQHQTEKEPNIPLALFEKLESVYGQKPSPEDILYYIYAVFYSTIYRKTYAEFLRIDFPHVPFTADYDLFQKMGGLGKELADLHLLKSPALDPPIAKYQGNGTNDRIEKITYKEDEQRIYINKDKYFEGIAPEVWSYHIGGYQVLQKYLKDRKGRNMDGAPRYCRIVTALSKTIEVQKQIDEIYPEVEKELV
jgi:predicted helicase